MEASSKHKEYLRLVLVLLVLFIILGGFLLYVSFPLLATRTVTLATQPVDPFDLIRGQYVVIRYEIGTTPFLYGAEIGDSVYVALKNDPQGIAHYDYLSLNKLPRGELFIKGKVKSISSTSMQIEYGIEQYFFERNAQFTTQNMTVKVKLSDSGIARIVELLQNGNPIKIDYQNKALTS